MTVPINEPTLTRKTIVQRAILQVTNTALDEWDRLPASIASDVLVSVIDILNDELNAFNQSETNRKPKASQGTTVDDDHGPNPFDELFCRDL